MEMFDKFIKSDKKPTSKTYLQKALFELMIDNPFENIKIVDVVAKAGVSRMSFYRNYQDKEELLADLSKEIFNELLSVQAKVAETYKDDAYRFYKDLFTIVKSNKRAYDILVKSCKCESNLALIIPQFEKYYEDKTPSVKYSLVAHSQGLNAVMTKWAKDGMKESVDDMALICEDLFKSTYSKIVRLNSK